MLLKFSTIISVSSSFLLHPTSTSDVPCTFYDSLTAPIHHHDLLLYVCSQSRARYLRSTAHYPLSIHSDLDLSYRVLELLMREERHGINFGRSHLSLGMRPYEVPYMFALRPPLVATLRYILHISSVCPPK